MEILSLCWGFFVYTHVRVKLAPLLRGAGGVSEQLYNGARMTRIERMNADFVYAGSV